MRWVSWPRGGSRTTPARPDPVGAGGAAGEWAATIRARLTQRGQRATLTFDEAIALVCEATGWPVGHVWVDSATGWRSSGAWHACDDSTRTADSTRTGDSRTGDFTRAAGYSALREATAITDLGAGRGIVAAVLHLESCRFLPGLDGLGSPLRQQRAAALGLRAVVGVPARLSAGGQRVGAVLEFITAVEIEPDGELAQALLDVAERTRRRVVRKATTSSGRPSALDLGVAPDHLAG